MTIATTTTATTATTTRTSTKTGPSTELGSKLAYLTRALKTPTIARVWDDLAAQARELNWSHEEYLTAVLERQVADRESAGTTMRIRTAHFPTVKTLEEVNLDHLPSLRRDLLAHLATSTFVAKAENVILLGPPGIGKTHLAIGLGVKATQAGYSVLFDTASNWITRLAAAHQSGQLDTELRKIRRYKLIISRSATSRSTTTRRTCSSSSSPPATNRARSWSPRTCPSAAGVRSSATRSSPPR